MQARGLEVGGPYRILLLSSLLEVLSSVDFDNQMGPLAVEIEDVWSERVLAPKLGTDLIGSQLLPEQCFYVRLRASEAARSVRGHYAAS